MQLIEDLKWRYATKKFDPTQKVSPENLEIIKNAIRLAPSSMGLEPYQVLHIVNPEIRVQLREVSWKQSAITDASDIFVFCNMTEMTEEYLDYIVGLRTTIRNGTEATKKAYKDYAKRHLDSLSEEELFNWSSNDSFIAATLAMVACAELHIDTCPMGGFEADKYSQILDLDSKGLNPSLVVAIGYRSTEDDYQHEAKVRKTLDKLFIEIV